MIETLKKLALMGAVKKAVKVSSKEFAEKIDQSIQTAARKLKELEEVGYIERVLTKDGQFVVITERGKEVLYREYLDYRKIFEDFDKVVLKGKVTSGLGEGKYYVSLEGYKRQFVEKLGFEPFPGTLNLKLDKEQLVLRTKLDELNGILIEGFKTEDRTFGNVKAFKCRIDGIDGAIIIPERTHYSRDVVEVIAPVNLRKELKLKDGDEVVVEVTLYGLG